jgi:hypothetical protein
MGVSGVPLDKSIIIQALYEKEGIITHAAASIGCDTSTIYHQAKSDPDVAYAIKDAREKADQAYIDRNHVLKKKAYASAENALDKGDITMTIFLMKTVGGLKENHSADTFILKPNNKPYNNGNRDSSS